MLDLFPRDTEELARSLVFSLLGKLVLTSEKLLLGPPLNGTTLPRPEQMRLYKSGSSAAHLQFPVTAALSLKASLYLLHAGSS